jgi:membrane dipeptidase
MAENSPVSRRTMLKGVAATCAAAVAAPMINRGHFQLFAQSQQQYSARAIGAVQRATVIDMLSVLTLNFPEQDKWFANPETFTAANFQKFKDSGINVIHPAVGLGGVNAYETALTFFAGWNGFIGSCASTAWRISRA